jgi:hypothetical protein
MLAMARGLLGGMVGGEAAGVDGSGEGADGTFATPAEGFLAASGIGELAHTFVD